MASNDLLTDGMNAILRMCEPAVTTVRVAGWAASFKWSHDR